MKHTIQNEFMRVTASETGAELQSAVHLATGAEMIWQADPGWWPRQAPLLFPHCGSVYRDRMVIEGAEYPSPRHGFLRDMPFALVSNTGTEMALRFAANDESRAKFPFDYAITVTYTLQGNTLLQRVEVENSGGKALPFNLGFHPGFALPFAPGKKTEDYEFAFDGPETPTVVETTAEGLVSGETRPLFEGESAIPLTDALFANDSICMQGLQSQHLTLRDKADPSQYVRVDIAEFPYVLVWGPPKGPLPFVCIEPWHGVPDPAQGYGEFAQKPGVQTLPPGESFATTLKMEFGR